MIKAMSFNLRVESANDGINRFFLRTDRVLEAIRTEAPDLIGFQEATYDMRTFLRNALLEEYVFIGGGSYSNHGGSGNPIAFKRNVFELVGLDTKWLSPTPDISGSRYENSDQSKYPRYYLLAILRAVATNELLWFINVHTDHVGVNVRTLEAQQLLEVFRELHDKPTILLGDLNARPYEDSIRILSSALNLGIADVTTHIKSTFHQFGKLDEPYKIDYIFTNLPCVESHAVEDAPKNGVYISDHNPIVALLKTPSESNQEI